MLCTKYYMKEVVVRDQQATQQGASHGVLANNWSFTMPVSSQVRKYGVRRGSGIHISLAGHTVISNHGRAEPANTCNSAATQVAPKTQVC